MRFTKRARMIAVISLLLLCSSYSLAAEQQPDVQATGNLERLFVAGPV